jgi:hypothetical protein
MPTPAPLTDHPTITPLGVQTQWYCPNCKRLWPLALDGVQHGYTCEPTQRMLAVWRLRQRLAMTDTPAVAAVPHWIDAAVRARSRGQRLRVVLRKLRITQEQAAEAADIDLSGLKRRFRGRPRLTMEFIEDVAAAADMPPAMFADLIGWIDVRMVKAARPTPSRRGPFPTLHRGRGSRTIPRN